MPDLPECNRVGRSEDARTPLEVAYDDRISRLKTALRMGMPADLAINEDTRLSVEMDALRENAWGAVEALEDIANTVVSFGSDVALDWIVERARSAADNAAEGR